jgi:uncharacterized membrane-anchored protein YhcB (DUF1043 family)
MNQQHTSASGSGIDVLVDMSIQALHQQLTEQNKHLRAELDKAKGELATLRESHGELVNASQSLISRLEIDCNDSDYSLLKRCRQTLAEDAAAKGDKARLNAAGLEQENRELREALEGIANHHADYESDARLMKLRAKQALRKEP